MKKLTSAPIAMFLLAVLFMPDVADAQEYEPAITDTNVVRLVDVMDVYRCEDGTTTATCAAISFIICFKLNVKAHCERIGVPRLPDDPGMRRVNKSRIYFRITSLLRHPDSEKITAANPLQAIYMFIQTGTMKGDGSEKPLPGLATYSDENFAYAAIWFVFRPVNGVLKLMVWDTFYDEGGCDDDTPMCDFNGAPSRVFDEFRSKP